MLLSCGLLLNLPVLPQEGRLLYRDWLLPC